MPKTPLVSTPIEVDSASVETVRVPAARLDELLEQVGELIVPRVQISEALSLLQALRVDLEVWQRAWQKLRPRLRQIERTEEQTPVKGWTELLRFLEQNEANLIHMSSWLSDVQATIATPITEVTRLTSDLQTGVKRLRMVPFGTLAERLERTVRDLTRSLGKPATLIIQGRETEVDRLVLEELRDPLVHLVRNALDHGIEAPDERERRGKPRTGTIKITAMQRGASIMVVVSDDGGGLDPNMIRHAAVERELITPDEVATMSDKDVMQLVFLPGLSTRSTINDVSGRGVGLDVAAQNIARLAGHIEVTSSMKSGTRFTATLPLTLTTTRALLIEIGSALYALPTTTVERVIRVPLHAPSKDADYTFGNIGGRPILEYDGVAIPIAPLGALLDSGGSRARATSEPANERRTPQTLVLAGGEAQRAAFVVDRVVDEQEIVVKPLGYPLIRVRNYAGATILGSGRVVPILNIGDLMRSVTHADHMGAIWNPQKIGALTPLPELTRSARVLIADDSLTTRTLERYVLETAGYAVEVASNGIEALQQLQEHGCDILISDVDMPELDGITLTTKIRSEAKFRELPVILVTSLASPEDRERGLQAGANAYIVKSAFDQEDLLQTIRSLL